MAARNWLVNLAQIKAVGLDLNVLSPYLNANSNLFSDLHSGLKKKGIYLTALEAKESAFADLELDLGLSPEQIAFVASNPQSIEIANTAGLFPIFINSEEKDLDYGQKFSLTSVEQLVDYL